LSAAMSAVVFASTGEHNPLMMLASTNILAKFPNIRLSQ